MPRPRCQLVSPETTPYYHCINRCVRRSFLCGFDRETGKNFDHRKQWIAERIKELAQIFAIDVCSFGLMSNHFHVILRMDPERALAWTEQQVAERYAKLFRRTVQEARELPPEAWKKKVASWRHRLWSLSWFMRCLNEVIARRANREDNVKGRFWEGRFRSQALLDEGALLTCMTYVDLNPIRAGLAKTLEQSEFTSIRERLLAAARGKTVAATGLVAFADQRIEGQEPLPFSFADYAEVIRATAAAIREPEKAELPAPVGESLQGWGLDPRGFVASIREYARTFFTMVGHVQRIEVESRRRGYRRRPDLRGARRLYRNAAA